MTVHLIFVGIKVRPCFVIMEDPAMVDDRKLIIIKEIKHWKRNQLLPNRYCDFLIALYTHGEGIDRKSVV